jgi:hypothetical protein
MKTFTAAAIASSALLSVASAQQLYTIDPNSVSYVSEGSFRGVRSICHCVADLGTRGSVIYFALPGGQPNMVNKAQY